MKFSKKIGLGVTALAVGLLLGWSNVAGARQFGYKIDASTVDDVTTSVCVKAGETLRSFGNGVSINQVWALEREVGSPGSGTWKAVIGHNDIFPTTNGGAAIGGATQVDNYKSEGRGCYRLHMTTDSAGTAQVQIVGNGNTPSTVTRATHIRSFDDFFHGTLPITTSHNGDEFSWVVSDNASNNAVVPIIEGGQEGLMTFSSGDAGSTADAQNGSMGVTGYRSLVSSGLTIVEFRASMSQITDSKVNFGLGDTIADSTEQNAFKCDTNVCAEGLDTAQTDAATFMFDTDSADAQTDEWNAISMNAGTLGNAQDEYTTGYSPEASTFAVMRIEVTNGGHAFWYYNGTLVGAEPLALATSAVIFPIFSANSPDDGSGTVNKIYIDYIDWYAPRTAS